MEVKELQPPVKRIVLDSGFADIVTFQPKPSKSKIRATLLNFKSMSEKKYDVDRAFYGCYKFIEFSPESITKTFVASIRMYLLERLWSLTCLEVIR
ncbi:MAG: hypothetical protein ACE5PO_05905 [Candidatus Bathyarchaeia archaeon]